MAQAIGNIQFGGVHHGFDKLLYQDPVGNNAPVADAAKQADKYMIKTHQSISLI